MTARVHRIRGVYSDRQLAAETSIGRSASWIRKRALAGDIPCVRLDGRLLFKRADLLASGWLPPDDGAPPMLESPE